MDYELRFRASPGNACWLMCGFQRIETLRGERVFGVAADYSLGSMANQRFLQEKDIFNGLCPRDSRVLWEQTGDDEIFGSRRKRSGQSEARIGVFKNAFLRRSQHATRFK